MSTDASLDLGIIGNGSIAALIAFDGDPVFCALLSPRTHDAGYFDIALDGESAHSQRYLDNSAVLVTELASSDGSAIEITDFAPRYKQYGRYFHPMSLIRSVRPIAGAPRITLRLRPLADYGAQRPERTFGSNHLRFLLDGVVLRATTDAPLPMLRDELPFLLDREIHIVLGPDEVLTDAPARHARAMREATLDYWRDWVRYLSIPAEWQEAVIRAAITLKLSQYEGTGAIVAAMTTSIPEAPGTQRNWDYRYCWLRDAAFVVRALNRLGATRSMEEYLRYIFNLAVSADGALAPVYGIHFERELIEREAEHLAGYRGMGPVRVGNDAWRQRQHDAYGSVVLAATQLFFDHRLAVSGDAAAYARLERCGEAAWRLREQADAGLWEFRSRALVHTYSSTMCWAACDRLARIASALHLDERATLWRERANEIRTLILSRALHRDGHFVDAFDGNGLDASLLLLADLGFVAYDDPRYRATVDVIGRELRRGDHMFRYIAPDDFGAPETSFAICSFWYVDALAATGRVAEARALFEHLLTRRNPLGLLSEDLHPATGELWGNFPQTYSLVGLINSAMRLSRRWEDLL
ncbi:MAG: glycoside hydrolase family 15 protein [Gammaproteobacteria bacterium]|nr:MAG: glycoside hydrolase family 15 protein [Gammaproteobacteria bacterium]